MIPKKCFPKKLFVFICSFKLAISLDSWQTSLFGYCSSSDEEASKFNNLAESLIIVITINVFQVCSQNLKRIEGGTKTIEQLKRINLLFPWQIGKFVRKTFTSKSQTSRFCPLGQNDMRLQLNY